VTGHDVESLRAEMRAMNNRMLEILLQIVASDDAQSVASNTLQEWIAREAMQHLKTPENPPAASMLRSLIDRAGRSTLPPVEPPPDRKISPVSYGVAVFITSMLTRRVRLNRVRSCDSS
jgi:hypothetical protein